MPAPAVEPSASQTDRAEADNSDDNDQISLPHDTLAILQQFLKDKADREKFEEAAATATVTIPTFKTFEENWQLSQFWYNDKTKEALAAAVRCIEVDVPVIGLLSCPSLYDSVKAANPNGSVTLFEFDERFAAYGTDFVHYDYNRASESEYLQRFIGYFDLLIADPPFLAEECIEKLSIIVKRLLKNNGKVILCSGEVVEGWAQHYMGLKKCHFEPEHERNLGNAFASYANFDLDEFIKTVKRWYCVCFCNEYLNCDAFTRIH